MLTNACRSDLPCLHFSRPTIALCGALYPHLQANYADPVPCPCLQPYCMPLECRSGGLTWAAGAIWCRARASTLAVTPVPHEAMMGFLRSTPASLKTVLSSSGPLYLPSWSTCDDQDGLLNLSRLWLSQAICGRYKHVRPRNCLWSAG